MAQVWEATDEVLARRVAVKVLHPHLAADESFVERFRREAVAAARLSHPSIVSIYDTCADDDCQAIVMELVEGATLRELLDERKWLEPGQAVAIIAEVADALETAHQGGVVHRDVKPANILLSPDGRCSSPTSASRRPAATSPPPNTTLGTAKYLAPEQVEGKPVDARADVYALGVVLYETLCGRPPFVADTEAATALARLHQEPMRPRNVRAGVPKAIEDVVLHAMARDPDQRYPSAAAFRAALLSAGRGAAPAQPLTIPLRQRSTGRATVATNLPQQKSRSHPDGESAHVQCAPNGHARPDGGDRACRRGPHHRGRPRRRRRQRPAHPRHRRRQRQPGGGERDHAGRCKGVRPAAGRRVGERR